MYESDILPFGGRATVAKEVSCLAACEGVSPLLYELKASLPGNPFADKSLNIPLLCYYSLELLPSAHPLPIFLSFDGRLVRREGAVLEEYALTRLGIVAFVRVESAHILSVGTATFCN